MTDGFDKLVDDLSVARMNGPHRLGPLYAATKDLHHACEAHPIGSAMADGSISARAWTEWLAALLTLHRVLDPVCDPAIHRCAELHSDLVAMRPMLPSWQNAASAFAAGLTTDSARAGAIYVLTGAHLMGGALTEKRLREAGRDLPVSHLRWRDRGAAMCAFRPYRDRIDAVDSARGTFLVLISIMQGIWEADR